MAGNLHDRSDKGSDAAFFVAPDGNDRWSGRLAAPNAAGNDGPFATLARARDAVREVKTTGAVQEPITVMVRGGKYYLDRTLILGPEDSGTQDSPVTFRAYPGEKPILSGGRRLTCWTPYKGKILQGDFPETKGGKWKFRQLFFNGQRQIRARYPKFDPDNPLYGGWAFAEGPADDGCNRAADFPNGYGLTRNWSLVEASEGGTANAFRYRPGAFVRHWSKPSEGEVFCFPGAGWSNNIIPIKAMDEQKRVITLQRDIWQFDRSPWYRPLSFTPFTRFYVENILEELTEPGEWCLDSEEGILYFWPPTDGIGDGEVVVPALHDLVSLRGVSWVTLSGFTFTETLDGDDFQHDGLDGYGGMFPRQGWRYCGDALHLRRARHCRIENNHFDAVGGNAIYLESANLRNVIQHNEISRAGANGICVIGSFLYHPKFNQILDNHIHHCGVMNKFIAGVFMGVSEGTLVAHNYIHDLPHHAINLGTNGMGRNIIEYNEIRRVALEIYDTGAINSWMDMSKAGIIKDAERVGHVIRYNLIADVFGCRVDRETLKIIAPDSEGCTYGIYLDDCTSNCFVYGNIILRAATAMVVHNGKNNWFENNIAVDCRSLLLYCDGVSPRGGCAPLADFMTGNRTCRNILYSSRPDGAVVFALHKWGDEQVEMSDENLFFSRTGGEYRMEGPAFPDSLSLAEWRKMGYDAHSITADPLFVDPEHEDYRLAPESPAWRLGFQPIDTSRIGIRKNAGCE